MMREIALELELECLEKTEGVMRKEIGQVKARLAVDTAYSRILDLEKRLSSSLVRNAAISKKVEKLNLRIGRNETWLGKSKADPAHVAEHEEEEELRLSRAIIAEQGKAEQLEARQKREAERMGVKRELCDGLLRKIAALGGDPNGSKADERSKEPPPATPEQTANLAALRSEQAKLRAQLRTEKLSYKREECAVEESIASAKAQLAERTKVLFTEIFLA